MSAHPVFRALDVDLAVHDPAQPDADRGQIALEEARAAMADFCNADRPEEIIFAVTSSNQENSRYNPIPFYMMAHNTLTRDIPAGTVIATAATAPPMTSHFHRSDHAQTGS